MLVTWIKKSVALSLTLLTTIIYRTAGEAGGFGRFVFGQILNQDSVPAAKFSIGLFASNDGKVKEKCPQAFFEVRDLAPNTVAKYTIRLPLATEKKIDAHTAQAKSYSHFATAIDFFGLIPEADKTNNTAILLRDKVAGASKAAE